MKKTAQIATIATLAITMAACSTFRGPRPINPNDDSQFENLPPAPAVETISEAPTEAPAEPTEAAPSTLAESAPEAPETGSANLASPIEGSVIESEAAVAAPAAASTSTAGELNDLLKVRIFYFGTNLSDITALSYGGLNAHAKYLQANRSAKLQISGHTDERGTREYNLALGERRANAVARYLVGLGVSAEQLSVVSYGKEKPAADGSDEEAWAKNRRVEVDYTAQ